jgi:enoyl-CoA hydratase
LQRLPRIVEPGRAAELVYTGRDLTAAEAAEIGLVSRVVPDQETVLEEALTLAAAIAANSPLAVQGAKAVFRARQRADIARELDYVALWNSAFFHSDDLAEAIRAFLEKRPPDFRGT